MYIFMACVCVCLFAHVYAGTYESQKKVLGLLQLVFGQCGWWRPKSDPLQEQQAPLNHWNIFSAPHKQKN